MSNRQMVVKPRSISCCDAHMLSVTIGLVNRLLSAKSLHLCNGERDAIPQAVPTFMMPTCLQELTHC